MADARAKDLEGRVAVVTGANTGIGKVTASELAGRGARVIIACRSTDKAQPLVDEIKHRTGKVMELVRLDLASLESVREAAREILSKDQPIHVLVNNAGLAGQRGQTADGFELAFGVNHVGHFLLTKLLLPRIRESTPARIVTVASQAHYRPESIDWEAVQKPTQTVSGLAEYGVSKLANVLFSAELARRLGDAGDDGVTTYSLHPGVVSTDVWRRIPWPFRSLMKVFMLSEEEGARTTLYCAAAPEAGDETGLYYDREKPKEPSKAAQDVALAKELWERSEGWVSEFAA